MAKTLTQRELEYEIADEMIVYADEHAHLWRDRDDGVYVLKKQSPRPTEPEAHRCASS